MRYATLGMVLPLLLLASCGEKPESSETADIGKDAVAQDSKRIQLVPAGNSGLIPDQSGFVEVDADRVQAAKSGGRCAVDAINGQKSRKAAVQKISVAGSDRIKFSGWGLSPDNRSPALLAVVLQGSGKAYALRADGGQKRVDVARAMKSAEAGRAGYSVESDLQDVLPGEYAVSILQDTGGVPTVCASRFKVVVAGK